MITYLIKFICSSALLWVSYKFLLEKEKIHKFNRFFLLGAIAFSLTAPFISFPSKITTSLIPQTLLLVQSSGHEFVAAGSPMGTPVNGSLTPIIIYCVISFLFLFRFTRNLMSLLQKARQSKKVSFGRSTLVLVEEETLPFSFANYIFVNRTNFEEHRLENEILQHELTHVTQKHTLDILFVELLLAFAWINPFLFLYRRAIRLNHEFLADQSVVSKFDAHDYQVLLLNKTNVSASLPMSSTFNYSLTKTRLIMMTRKTSSSLAVLREGAAITVVAAIAVLFGENAMAQQSKEQVVESPAAKNLVNSAFPKPNSAGVSSEMMDEYKSIINKYPSGAAKKWNSLRKEITYQDYKRLDAIFSEMSDDQRMKQTIVFFKPMLPAQTTVTQADLESWKDPAMYGVWIDGDRIDNKELIKFSPSDFHNAATSVLAKNATNYGKHKYQVDLMTKKYYELYAEKIKADGNHMAFRASRANGVSEYQKSN